MTKRVSSLVLAIVMLLQILVPQTIIAKEEVKSSPDKQVQIGLISGNSYDSKLMLELNRLTAKSRRKRAAEPGTSLFGYFDDGQEPKDEDKLKYHGEVKAELTVKGIDGGEFPWKDIFGNEEVHLRFSQINDETGAETGVERVLNINQAGTYTWTDGEGNPAELPLFNNKLEPLIYEVKLDEEVSDKVKLLTARLTTTGDASPTFDRPDADGRIKYHLTLEIGLQQVASSKFISEWHTAVVEGERPQLEATMTGSMNTGKSKTISFNLPTKDGDEVIVRTASRHDKNKFIPEFLYKTPTIKLVETNANGLTFDTTNKAVKSGDHKFKYDFNYDVINGGKLTMTEILPVTFDANGGKFASIEEGKDQKIVKEVDYGKDLTDKAENPTKDRETFKGWSTTEDGKTPATDADFKDIIKAKTFYAIWDNNDILSEKLEVKESFKDGTGYVNDFIPTLDTLKKQVKIKDPNGDLQALTTETFAIVDGSKEYTADSDELKNYLYGLLQEKANPKGEPTRTVNVKAKVTFSNKKSKTVDIPIKVIKNIYEAKTEEGKPNYVPDNYVKVTVDPTTKAKEPQKYFYYVNPAAKVVIPGKDPVGTGDNTFVKWIIKGSTEEYKLAEKPRHKFDKATTIEAQYESDVIPQKGTEKPDTVPTNYVEVKFVPTDKATDETKAEKIFWVNPEKEVTIPVKDPVGKQYFTFKEWKMGANAKGDKYTPSTPKKFTEATTITATYEEAKNIIPYDPKEPTTRPEGYVRVTFKAEKGLNLTEQKAYYVKKNAKDAQGQAITLGNVELVKPSYEAQTGYTFDKWDKEDTTKIETTDIVVTAKATKLDNVIPEKDSNGNDNTKPEGYKEVTFVVKDDDKTKGSLEGTTKYYVNPTEYVTINPPATKPNTGYEFGAWDKDTKTPNQYKDDEKITGSFNDLENVIPKIKPDGSANTKPEGYYTVTFEIEKVDGKEPAKFVKGEKLVYFVKPNASVTINPPQYITETGYKFDKWDQDTTTAKKYTDDTTVKGNFKKLDDIIPEKTGDTPNAKPEGYVTVTFEKGEHGKEITGQSVYYVNPKADPVVKLGDAKIKKPEVKAEVGYKFIKWDTEDTFEIKDNKIVIAQYESIDDVIAKDKPTGGENTKPEGYITVTFSTEANGKIKNSAETTKIVYVNPNKAVVLKGFDPEVTPNTGFDFAGWDTSIDKAIQYKDKDVIKAKYNVKGDVIPQEKTDGTDKPAGYLTVTFDKGEHGDSLTGKTVYYVKPNKEVTVPAPAVKPNVGYEFEKWDKELTQTFTQDTKITAGYKALDGIIPQKNTDGSDKPDGYHTVTFKVVNGTTSGQTVFYVNGEKEIDLTNTANGISKKANIGYTDEGVNWSPAITNKKYTADAEYTFTFKELADVIEEKTGTTKPDGYVKVEFIAGDNGSLQGGDKTYYVNPSKKVKAGSNNLPIPTPKPNDNYKFYKWLENIDKNEEITTDKRYVATFKINKVTMTYKADDKTSGTVPKELSYDIGTEITLAGGNDLKKDNYVLKGWNINGQIYAPGATYKIEANTTATAEWDTDFHTVNFDTGGGTHIDSQKVKHNELIKPVTNPEKVNYTFTGWKVDGQDFDPATSKVTKDITLVAQYVSNVVEQTDPTKPKVPENFVKVIVKTTDKATDATAFEKTFWVNPEKVVTIPAINPIGKVVKKVNGDVDYTWLFIKWDEELTKRFAEETTITAQYKKGYELPEVKPIPDAYGDFIYTDYGKEITDKQYKDAVKLPEGYSFENGTKLEIVEETKANVNKKGRYNVSAWVKYPNGEEQLVKIIVFVGEEKKPTPPTPEPGYPGGPDYPYYPGRPIPMYPEVRYETIIQEKIVKVPVPVSDNYFKEVRYMQGFNGYFRPNDGLTRAEAAQILANALVEDGYKYNPNFKISYKDIGEAWYTRAVKIVTEANVFAGYDDGNFKPQAKITRNEWIATLKRFQELGDASGNNMNLSDNHWAKGEIQAAFNEGWLKIYTDGLATYKGDEFIPRQEVAAVSNKAFKRIVDKTYIGKNNLSLVTYKDVNTSMWAYEDILCASNTFLDRKDRYIAHWVKEDKNQFNIDTSDLKIVQKNFQRNPR